MGLFSSILKTVLSNALGGGPSDSSNTSSAHFSVIISTPDPAPGQRVDVRDRIGTPIGFARNTGGYILYHDFYGNIIATKYLMSGGHYDLKDAHGNVLFHK